MEPAHNRDDTRRTVTPRCKNRLIPRRLRRHRQAQPAHERSGLDRARFQLPRFERLRTTLEHDVSALFISDPALWKDPQFALAWYTGWGSLEMHRVSAAWAARAAEAVGATRVVFSGSSGGGFAALQTARFLPGSLALPFNPQTSIYGCLAGGREFGAQRKYIEVLRPDLAPRGVWRIDWDVDWTADLGDAFSALRTYARPVDIHVLYADNPNDFHHTQHYLPFIDAASRGQNLGRLRTHGYGGPVGHEPPNPQQFHAAMAEALAWVRELPPARPEF